MAKQTIAQLEGRAEELLGLMEKIHAYEVVDEDAQKRFDEYASEYATVADDLSSALREQQLEAAKLKKVATREAMEQQTEAANLRRLATDSVRVRGDAARTSMIDDDPFAEPASTEREFRGRDPWNLDEMRTFGQAPDAVGTELRARALSAIEKMSGTNDKRRAAMTEIIERWDTMDGKLARQALATSSPEYVRAFAKLASSNGTARLTDAEARAMSLTDSAGGYLVPFQLDPSVIITADGSFNQIRNAARVVQATGDVWNGVSSAGVTWSWYAEAAQVTDDAPTLAQPTVAVHKAMAYVPISIEAYDDAANVTQEVGRMLAFGKDTLEATAFATGSGSGEPFGIVTAVTGEATASATTDTFALADVYALDDALPARYRFNASWLANRSIYNLIRQFDTAGGAALWERLGNDVPPLLLGRPAYEAEGMDGTITALSDNYVLIYGDFSNYVVADRIGTRVEFVPTVFGANQRPTGQRGWHAWYRVGADSVNDSAFELLNVT